MKVKTKLVITDEVKVLLKSFRAISKSDKTAYTFMSGTSGTVMVNQTKTRTEVRSAATNEKILADLALGKGTTTLAKQGKAENKKPRRKYVRKAPLPMKSDRSFPPRNPVFLSTNELKAVFLKANKILGDAIDPIKQYSKITTVLSEMMVFYFKKHIQQGIMENGPVAPLKERYARTKLLLYGQLPILVRTGQLIKSFTPKVR